MVSFSICISPTNAPISLVPPRFNNITHCCEGGMHACKFATVFRQFRGCEPDALLPLLCRKIATGYSAISIIDVNTFFLVRRWFTRMKQFLNEFRRWNRFDIERIKMDEDFLQWIIKHIFLDTIWYSSYFEYDAVFENNFKRYAIDRYV